VKIWEMRGTTLIGGHNGIIANRTDNLDQFVVADLLGIVLDFDAPSVEVYIGFLDTIHSFEGLYDLVDTGRTGKILAS
jgi:hypothetical protein